jgi:hypothetical protein
MLALSDVVLVALIGGPITLILGFLIWILKHTISINDSVNHKHPEDRGNGRGLRDITIGIAEEVGAVKTSVKKNSQQIKELKDTPPCVHPETIRTHMERAMEIAKSALSQAKEAKEAVEETERVSVLPSDD